MKVLGMFFCILTLVSCNGSGGGGGSSSSNDNLNLVGTWLADCEDDSGESSQLEWVVTSSVATFRQSFYSDTGCSEGDKYEINDYNYSYETTATSFVGTLNSFEITLTDSSTVSSENSSSYCGYNDWVINVEKDVTGQDCDGLTENAGDSASADITQDENSMTLAGVDYTRQ